MVDFNKDLNKPIHPFVSFFYSLANNLQESVRAAVFKGVLIFSVKLFKSQIEI